ncbi:MAG: uridylate kinase [Methanocorpusculum sp.]|nr:uridylate kinase [Methanocorpusculum sp.]
MHAKGIVLKIGGSLIDVSKPVLSQISENIPVLIIPGGGPFADFVREAEKDDNTSHWNAILAMDRFGRYLSTFGFRVTKKLSFDDGISIFLPYKILKERDPLPHSWEVTSDSIAAWAASELNAPLILVKSVSADYSETLSASGVIDEFIFSFAEKKGVDVRIANGRVNGEIAFAIEQATRL